jgi:hypothetical protein
VAKLHGVALELSERSPGLKVVLVLPCGDAHTPPGVLAASADAGPTPPSPVAAATPASAAAATTAPSG